MTSDILTLNICVAVAIVVIANLASTLYNAISRVQLKSFNDKVVMYGRKSIISKERS